jgi:hypothetical protein
VTSWNQQRLLMLALLMVPVPVPSHWGQATGLPQLLPVDNGAPDVPSGAPGFLPAALDALHLAPAAAACTARAMQHRLHACAHTWPGRRVSGSGS